MSVDLNDPELRQRYDDHMAVCIAHRARPSKFARDYTAALMAAGRSVPNSEMERLKADLLAAQKAIAALQAQSKAPA